jgi:PAS domain S-box-containing protein
VLAIATAPPAGLDDVADARRKALLFGTAEGHWQALGYAVVAAAMYFVGVEVGMALVFDPVPLSILWPPNALLFAALLLAPTRWWTLILACVLPVHLLAELQTGVDPTMALCWFVSNASEALIGAAFVRHFAGATAGFDTVRSTIVFCAGTVLAVFVSCFLDAAFVRLVQPSSAGYWKLWEARFFANILATLTFVPIVVTSVTAQPGQFRSAERFWWIEPAVLLAGLMAVSVAIFDSELTGPTVSPTLLYLPMPFLVWAALRFGPPMTSATFTMVTFLVVWGARHGRGPFLQATTHADALPVQLFLIATAVPLLLLAAVIQERRSSERKLRASEDLFSTAFRSSPDAIAISRRVDGRVIEANDRWLALMGYEADQIERGGIASLADHADEASRAHLAQAREAGAVRDTEVTLRDCHGAVRHALVSITGVEVQGQPCELSIVRDVTEQRHAESEAREQRQQLTHLTRVAAVTELSGTLAHELNQPLTAILSNAQAALRFLSNDPYNIGEIRAILLEIAEEDKRAGALIHHLRLLMKKGTRGEDEFARIDLNQLVREVLGFVHGESVRRDVDVTASFWPDLPHVAGDRVQLQQLVLNLVSNAYEAMRQPAAAKSLGITTVHGYDGTVQLVISDTGPGIAADRLEKIFEPFFTTKENGLGLGLSICRKIARAHGGTLLADSREGEGAIFRLVLPRAEAHERANATTAAERR